MHGMHDLHARCAALWTAALAAAILCCTYALPASAAQRSGLGGWTSADQSIATNLPGTRAYLAPPAGFDPLTASDAQLEAFGFPPRPGSDSPAYFEWQRAVTSPALVIQPTLVQTSIVNGALLPALHPAFARIGNAVASNSSNWSGYSVVDSNRPFKNEEISTQFLVPVAQQAFGSGNGGWDYGSAWDGIDGNGSSDVLQAGIEFDAYENGTSTNATYAAWYEWAPAAEVRISNMPVAPGDLIRVIVWNSSTNVGHAEIVNFTANREVKVVFNAPSGRFVWGNSLEWIVERPTIGNALATLTNYVGDPFTDNFAFNTTGTKTYYYPGRNATGTEQNITMDDNNGKPISIVQLGGLWDLWFYDEGSAYKN